MKRILTFIMSFCILISMLSGCAVVLHDAPNGIENVYIVSNAEKYRRDEYISPTPETKLTASLAKYEGEGMQFILKFPKDVAEVKVAMTDLVLDGGTEKIEKISLYKEHYINCTKDYNKSTPAGYYPDALIPIDGDLQINNSVDIPANNNQGYWITVKTAGNQTAGIYKGEVTVSYKGGKDIKIPVEVEVWDFELPVKPSFETAYAVSDWSAFSYLNNKNVYVPFNELRTQLFEFSYEYRVSGGYLPIEYNTSPQHIADQTEAALKKYPQVTCFNLGNPNKDLADALEAKGLLQYGYTYLFDEPGYSDEINENIQQRYKEVHSLNPHIRNMLTTAPRVEIPDTDIWCGIWSSYGCDEYVIRDFQEKGDTVWWYGCVGPQAPYPTYHIMDDVMTSRLVHWMQKDFNVTGNLYWATCIYQIYNLDDEAAGYSKQRDIWNDPYIFRYGDGSEGGAAGDGYLFYMGYENDGYVNKTMPVPTIRFEAIRDGNEDYEYLVLLENKIKALFEKWNITDITVDEYMDTYYDSLYVSMGNFDHSPDMLLKMRNRVANDIINAENLVMVSAAPCSDAVNRRLVRVYAENGSAVTIDGNNVEGKNMGAYSVYDKYFDMSKVADFTDIVVNVNGNEYKRTLKAIEDSEYMYDAKLKAQNNAKALGLENYSIVRDLFAKNTFVSFVSPSLGSLDEQLQNPGSGEPQVEVISNSEEMRNKVIKALAKEAENTIPVAVLNESDFLNKCTEEILSIYVPVGAEVKVNGNPATLIRSDNNNSLYEARVDTKDVYRASYELSVTYNGKTETWTKFLVNEILEATAVVDFSDPEFIEKMKAYGKNEGLVFDVVEYEGIPSLKITFNAVDDRITMPGNCLIKTNLNGYEKVYLDIVNLQDKDMEGVDIEICTSRDALPVNFKKTEANFNGMLSQKMPIGRFNKVTRILFEVGNSSADTETACGSYIIKGLYVVKEKNNDLNINK